MGTARSRWWLRSADLAATFLFAVGGATVAVDVELGIFGLLVLAFSTALVGGIVRDLLLGAVAPAALSSVDYMVAAFLGAFLVICAHKVVDDLPSAVIVSLDAAGLALFCVVGAQNALHRGLNRLAAVLLGTIGASGGGVVRDVLITRVPTVLREQVYAAAALAGATVLVASARFGYLPEDRHVPGLCRLLRPARGHRLAELEPPESDRLEPGPVDRASCWSALEYRLAAPRAPIVGDLR